MRQRSDAAILLPYIRRMSGRLFWLLGSLILMLATLAGSMGLLSLSGGFLTATAIAGLSPVTAMAFNFFLPGAGVRFFAILRTASRWGERVVTHEATFRLIAGLRLWLYRRISPLAPSQLGRWHGGELLNRLIRDVDALDNLYPRLLLPMVAAGFMLGLAGLLATFMLPALAPIAWLPFILAMGIIPLLGWLLGRHIAPARLIRHAALRRSLLDCSDGLDDLILHTAAWQRQLDRTLAASQAWLTLQMQFALRGAWLQAGTQMAVGLCAWAAFGLGASLLVDDAGVSQIDGPWLAAIILLCLGSMEALQQLPGAWLELPGTAAAARRLDELACTTPRPAFPERGAKPDGYDLQAHAVTFRWPNGPTVLDGLDLDVPYGTHLALLGPSGCGKSTLSQLLARLEDPDSGDILLGGMPLQAFDESTLRHLIACAPQDAWAQTATLADNLRLAAPDASDADLHAVLALVGLDETVCNWQDGLETWVAEGGASLSGGQRKRLAMARTLLRNAPITILDEPTEGLDTPSAQALTTRISQHLEGRTLIWITHRTIGLEAFDRTLTMTPVQG
ncbi:MAG: thiol reductant ABC exporter subunit CydC [Corticimicrobacter sp.]|uniref:thiol reductant ABC exporter subunit CydC n=1 Tax=Corticimicrobacter sp. TaxID=2678536 RepID=UPI0032DA778D